MMEKITEDRQIIKSLAWDFYRSLGKPVLDWIIAFIALIILFPLLMIVAIAIKMDTKGPVFFIQERLGRSGKVFRMFKFRSMIVSNTGNSGNKLYENDPRITTVGRFIRKTSIDELPQLLNILLGEMSFIGPRPPVPYYPKKIEEYTEYQFQRFLVRPGISGLGQVRCRENHDWESNFHIDAEYIQSYSFVLDVKLFIASLLVFFKTDNTYRKE